jgi:hypothetical protein
MAKQTVGIGSAANDGTGDPLRTAFDKLNDNFDEVYADDFVTTARIADDAITEAHLDVTNSPVDGYVLTYDSGSSGFTWEQKFDGDITGIVAGNGLTGDATSGDASLAVGAGTGITVNANDVQIADGGVDTTQLAADAVEGSKIADDAVDTEHIADDAVDHDQLANRYTASSAVTSATAITIDTSTADVFTWTAGHSTTVAFTNVKVGSTCALIVTGGGSSYTFALGNINGASGTFNRLAGTYDDTSSTKNLIEFKFISTSEAWYQISQIAT